MFLPYFLIWELPLRFHRCRAVVSIEFHGNDTRKVSFPRNLIQAIQVKIMHYRVVEREFLVIISQAEFDDSVRKFCQRAADGDQYRSNALTLLIEARNT